ncbi:hypothetical protein DFS34DRAFT_622771 [Phlyctochytrium arcticum]|nr:hypothetical protein DFS34DRAFT_622771 [Phlyctochytrium arcticum]
MITAAKGTPETHIPNLAMRAVVMDASIIRIFSLKTTQTSFYCLTCPKDDQVESRERVKIPVFLRVGRVGEHPGASIDIAYRETSLAPCLNVRLMVSPDFLTKVDKFLVNNPQVSWDAFLIFIRDQRHALNSTPAPTTKQERQQINRGIEFLRQLGTRKHDFEEWKRALRALEERELEESKKEAEVSRFTFDTRSLHQDICILRGIVITATGTAVHVSASSCTPGKVYTEVCALVRSWGWRPFGAFYPIRSIQLDESRSWNKQSSLEESELRSRSHNDWDGSSRFGVILHPWQGVH